MLSEERRFRGAAGEELVARAWRPQTEARAAVIAVHGFGDHSGRYGQLLEALVPRGLAVHAFDLRGHGRSPGRRGHIEHWAHYREDLRAFVRRTAREEGPERPLFLLGNSLGGLVVLEYAIHHPEGLAGVIADSPALVPTGVGNRFLRLLAMALSRTWPTFSVSVPMAPEPVEAADPAETQTAPPAPAPIPIEPAPRDPLLHSRLSARAATEAMAAIDFTRRNAARLRLPLLVLHGGADRIVDPEGSRAFVADASSPDKELLEYPGVFHDARADDVRERILDDIADWLERHIPAAR
jgi:alpha-beta hydrolase superfamily lysophospholipase